ncbi:mitochondrial hypoxia responsive domain-containing protein [Pochonia chlamydosporia 170]|uniref:Mitochondrial hypoxia responsive domain-containing protein n=1 Tax=Pochonia chlamydosporia 170 TaxID=1380566 RepID=A0A179FB27_METCM|nr:mitochondrial hypoxia responsive domain-containing protein [Pochonia chlamydosporia 170]OAQ62628.1 mitochondrial hypoxia responsive domain-containing protein [Pochonia chlamydosporia 170]
MADRLPPPMPGHLPSSFDDNDEFYNERPLHKVVRKLKEEPLVPLGIGLTVFAFVNAYRALRRGDSRQANKMFRARVAAQGFTVIAMVAGSMYYSQDRQKTKELRKLKEERDAEEKRQKWIRELEARDEEDKMMRASLEKRRQKVEAETAKSEEKGTGGILGKMGLWSKGEEAAKEAAKEADKEKKKENPKSSLGAIGEVLVKQKEDEGKK